MSIFASKYDMKIDEAPNIITKKKRKCLCCKTRLPILTQQKRQLHPAELHTIQVSLPRSPFTYGKTDKKKLFYHKNKSFYFCSWPCFNQWANVATGRDEFLSAVGARWVILHNKEHKSSKSS